MDEIILRGVKTHNLKNLDLTLNHNKLYVVTGVSGSGKSSLAFNTLYAEGQRRYVESLSAYARQFLERMEKPDIEFVSGIRPSIAIEAKNIITNARSTVGTQTEINDYLRVLFARIGTTYCPKCGQRVRGHDAASTAEELIQQDRSEEEVAILFKVPLAKKGNAYLKEFLPELEKQGFSEFYDQEKIVSSDVLIKQKIPSDSLLVCADRLNPSLKNKKRLLESLELAFRYGKGEIQINRLGSPGSKKMGTSFQFCEELRCFSCGLTFKKPSPNLFSFNSPLGACTVCQGFGRVITVDWDLVVPDPRKTIEAGAIEPWSKPSASKEFKNLLKFCKKRRVPVNLPWKDLNADIQTMILKGKEGRSQDEFFSVQDYFHYLEKKTYKMHVRIFLSKYRNFVPCPECRETRLKPEALQIWVRKKNIFELQSLSLESLRGFLAQIHLTSDEFERVEPVYLEIVRRVDFLCEVGLSYLTLSRLSRTLSGGEVQRIHLATSLGSSLEDTLYVLDEPSIGLHERDNDLLIRLLKKLRDLRNTVFVVEHDRTMIESADEVLDLGPAGGEKGGQLLFQGTVEALKRCRASLTGKYLIHEMKVFSRELRDERPQKWIRIRKASEHNLQEIDVKIPLERFVVITGVSGSGKSTLVYNVLYHQYLRFCGRPVQGVGKASKIEGLDQFEDMVLIDQSPIGRTPRSNPATYLNAYDEIRKIFAKTSGAQRKGFSAGHFSFNVDGGRCAACKGEGRIKIEMHFLADVFVPCEECQGKRFKPEILEIQYEGKNIDQVLAMTVDEACIFFERERKITAKLIPLQKVGLGYLRLGQSATTLSGGESQRLKLAYEMNERKGSHLLYIFDEPTTGLHYHDIHYLMQAFDELLRQGHSLIVIEHNMEVIRSSDYVIDLGPEGGDQGGTVVYQGLLRGLLDCAKSYTSQYLHKYLKN